MKRPAILAVGITALGVLGASLLASAQGLEE